MANTVTEESLKSLGWSDLSLRDYQLEGVNWLLKCYSKKHGCILGDEMGLGKTCQTIAMLAHITTNSDLKLPHLVLCPRSVLENWLHEFQRFAPYLEVEAYIGDKEKRAETARDLNKNRASFEVVLTSYEICMKDSSFLKSFAWNVLVVDEGHRLKNHESLLYRTLDEWDIRCHVLLTGTPVQNDLGELYSLLAFVDRKQFKPSQRAPFLLQYKDCAGMSEELHRLLKPMLLRRTKAAVLKELPVRTDVVLYHGLSRLQKKLYKAVLMKDADAFENTTGTTRLMNILMQLRKCVNHPYLFDGVEPEPFEMGEHLVEASAKLVLIDRLLSWLHDRGHKVLLFSQMTHMLDVLQDYLGYRGYTYERLDGSVRGEERFLAVQKFNQNDETFVFLLSTKAGGQGLNLTAADTVVFVDSDFNPQNDLQAAARAHRIGQGRPVKVIRLIGRNTVEEIILSRAEEKLKLTDIVIEKGEFDTVQALSSRMLDKDPRKLQSLLKFGVESLMQEQADEEEADFSGMLGRSEGGKWCVGTEDDNGREQVGEAPEQPSQSMYMFEGHDYSKDTKDTSDADHMAFKSLIELAKVAEELPQAERTLRKRNTVLFAGVLPQTVRKPRQPLTAEEKEARARKRREVAVIRAEKLLEKKRLEKEERWRMNQYVSLNIPSESEEEVSDDSTSPEGSVAGGGSSSGVESVGEDAGEDTGEDAGEDAGEDTGEDAGEDTGERREEPMEVGPSEDHHRRDQEKEDDDQGKEDEDWEAPRKSINYLVGDVTKPKGSKRNFRIIVLCADDSGRWGKGGLFTALGHRGSEAKTGYEAAGRMQDLALGDCHLIKLQDPEDASDEVDEVDFRIDFVGVIIAQTRDRRGQVSGIQMEALQRGLERVARKAKKLRASVHLPRIGHSTPGFNWYGTERLIQKILVCQGIDTYVYYFPRKKMLKRAQQTKDPMSTKVAKGEGDSSASDLRHQENTSGDSSPGRQSSTEAGFLSGVAVFLFEVPTAKMVSYKRLIVQHDGDVDSYVQMGTTHLVVSAGTDAQEIQRQLQGHNCLVVSTEWLDECFRRTAKVPEDKFTINMD